MTRASQTAVARRVVVGAVLVVVRDVRVTRVVVVVVDFWLVDTGPVAVCSARLLPPSRMPIITARPISTTDTSTTTAAIRPGRDPVPGRPEPTCEPSTRPFPATPRSQSSPC